MFVPIQLSFHQKRRDTSIPTLVILAAGLSRRYGRPKPLVPVGKRGEVLIDYSIHDAARAGFRHIVVVTRPELRGPLAYHLHTTWKNALTFQFVFQELGDLPQNMPVNPHREAPWGTAHAVLAARNVVQDAFVVINCDDFYGYDAYQNAAMHLRSSVESQALVGYRLDETLSPSGGVSRAICEVGSSGSLERLTEFLNVRRQNGLILGNAVDGTSHKFTGSEIISMNFWVFQPSIFQLLEQRFALFLEKYGQDLKAEFFLSNTINKIVASDDASVRVLPGAGKWFGMTYQDDLVSVVDSLASLTQSGVYPRDIASTATDA